LQGDTPQATTAKLSLNSSASQDYAIKISLSAKTVNFTLDNPQLGTVSPTSCILSSDNPTCNVTIKTINNWLSNSPADPVVQKGNIIATVSNTPSQLLSITTVSEAPQRRIHFQNQCPYDVWLGSQPSNAAVIGCSPDNTTAQANCPSGNVCFQQAGTSNTYCVPGTTTATSFPPTDPSKMTVSCQNYNTDKTSSTWGTCFCSTDNDCNRGVGQQCLTAISTNKQCFYSIDVTKMVDNTNANGKLSASSTSSNGYLKFPVDTNKTTGQLIGGKFYFKTGCNPANGLDCAVADLASATSSNTPQTLIEFTLTNGGPDYYDVSYINGVNIPVQFDPYYKAEANLSITPAGQNASAYWCNIAGGTPLSMATEYSIYETTHPISSGAIYLNPNLLTLGFGCAYNFNNSAQQALPPLVGPTVNATTTSPATYTSCTSSTGCSNGQACGLTINNVLTTANNNTTTCGPVEGYWTYAQLCAANNSFLNTAYGIDCTNVNNLAYSLCKGEIGADQGSARSCYNANSTTSGVTCCGYSNWAINGVNLLNTMNAVGGVKTSNWTTAAAPATTSIQSAVQTVKMACPTAYSYQYDDPYSTFTCSGTTANSNGVNVAHYNVTLCPSGSATSTSFSPTYVPCVPTTISGTPSTEFVVGYLNTQTTVASIFNTDTNTPITQLPDGYYSLTGNLNFGITATGSNGSSICYYTALSDKSCIILDNSKTNSPSCKKWLISTGSSWNGRSITVPSQGTRCMPQTPSGTALNEFIVGLTNTVTTSVSISNTDTNTTLSPLSDGNYNINGNLHFKIVATGGDKSTSTCYFAADNNTSCIALDTTKANSASCSTTWPISSGAPWTGRSITVPSQGTTPLPYVCTPSTPSTVSNTNFAIGIPSDYGSTVVKDNNGTIMSNAATGYYSGTGITGFTITTTKTSGTNSGSYSCVYTLASPTSCIVGPTVSSTAPSGASCPATDTSGAWQGRNIGFPY
jgi:hypothetical protein